MSKVIYFETGLSFNAARQEVSRCSTRGESEESIACKWTIHPGFEIQGRSHQKSKTGVSLATQIGLMFSKNISKNKFWGDSSSHTSTSRTSPQRHNVRVHSHRKNVNLQFAIDVQFEADEKLHSPSSNVNTFLWDYLTCLFSYQLLFQLIVKNKSTLVLKKDM